jgi:hypothetical protein
MSRLQPVFEKYGFTIESLEESAGARRIGAGEVYFRLASGYCCDTSILGRQHLKTQHDDGEKAKEKKLAELKKAGWTESRIRRWLEETGKKSEASARQHQKEAALWREFIRSVLVEHAVEHLGLMVHSYDEDGLTTAEIPIGKHQRVLLKNMNEDVLKGMEDGVLYRFVNSEF